MLALRLLDAQNNAVNVQLYFSCSLGMDRKRHYLIGVCENNAALRDLSQCSEADAEYTPRPLPERNVDQAGAFDTRSLYTFASIPESSVKSSELVQVEKVTEEGEVEVCFDAFSTGFRIQSCSASFTSITGPVAGGSGLLEFLQQPDDFQNKIEELVNAIMSDSEDGERETQDLGKITMRNPASGRAGLEYQGTCSVDCNLIRRQCQVNGFCLDEIIVRLTLHNLVIRRTKKAKPPGKLNQQASDSSGQPQASQTTAAATVDASVKQDIEKFLRMTLTVDSLTMTMTVVTLTRA